MQDHEFKGPDKLSNLAAELRVAESKLCIFPAGEGLDDAREEVVAALIGHRAMLYRLAEALSRYRAFFKAEHTWMAILDKIAAAYGRSSKTLQRLLKNYDDAQTLGNLVINQMLEEHIDPSLPRNRPMVKMLAQAPKPESKEEATAAVKAAQSNVIAMKNAARSAGQETESDASDEFARRLVRIVDPWYRAHSLATRNDELRYILEKLVNMLRADVRELRIYSRPDQVLKPAANGGR